MDITLILDVVIALLLAATIAYAMMLNRQLQALRQNRDDMAKLINNFNDATLRAESSIPKLRKAAEEASNGLQERVEKAQSLRDDLAFMTERADTMANRLEEVVRDARSEVRAAGKRPAANVSSINAATAQDADSAKPKSAAPAAAPTSAGGEDDRSEAERELLKALQSIR